MSPQTSTTAVVGVDQRDSSATDSGEIRSDVMTSVSGSAEVTERLLEAAIDVFAERGFEAARVAEIARRAGLTTGAIYARWPGKRDLIVAAVHHITSEFMQAFTTITDSPAEEVTAVLSADPASVRNARVSDVMLEALVSARRDDSFRAAVSDAMGNEAARLSAAVSRGKAEGAIDPELSTSAIVTMCQSLGLGMRLAVLGGPDRDSVQAAEWDALVKRLIDSLRPPDG